MQHVGIEVEERRVTVDELVDAAKMGSLTEAFGLGTAATVSMIQTLGLPGQDWDLPNIKDWKVAPKVKASLDGVRYGTGEDPFGWNIPI
jgi:branched-chain amino acid aminotransferase